MASGKTSVGKALAVITGRRFIDLDHYLEQTHNRTLKELFEEGEMAFRAYERDALIKLLASCSNEIVAVGGGTPCYYDNMALISKSGYSVYLRTTIPVLVNRLTSQAEVRPLLARIEPQDLPEFLGKHLFERRVFYERAQTTIDTQGSPQQLAKEIWDIYNSQRRQNEFI